MALCRRKIMATYTAKLCERKVVAASYAKYATQNYGNVNMATQNYSIPFPMQNHGNAKSWKRKIMEMQN